MNRCSFSLNLSLEILEAQRVYGSNQYQSKWRADRVHHHFHLIRISSTPACRKKRLKRRDEIIDVTKESPKKIVARSVSTTVAKGVARHRRDCAPISTEDMWQIFWCIYKICPLNSSSSTSRPCRIKRPMQSVSYKEDTTHIIPTLYAFSNMFSRNSNTRYTLRDHKNCIKWRKQLLRFSASFCIKQWMGYLVQKTDCHLCLEVLKYTILYTNKYLAAFNGDCTIPQAQLREDY